MHDITPLLLPAPEAATERAVTTSNDNQNILVEGAPKEALAHLLEVDYPKGWKTPRIPTYNGLGDPRYHIHAFTTGMKDITPRKNF